MGPFGGRAPLLASPTRRRRCRVLNLANGPHHDAPVWNTLINQQLGRFSIATADLIAASVAFFSVWLGANQCFCTAGKDHENEKMRPMPREVGLRRALPQYLERPLVGSPEFLFYSM